MKIKLRFIPQLVLLLLIFTHSQCASSSKKIESDQSTLKRTENAKKNRAKLIISNSFRLLKEAELHYAHIIIPNKYTESKKQVDKLNKIYQTDNYLLVYTSSTELISNLNNLTIEADTIFAIKLKNIDDIQKNYADAETNQLVFRYSRRELKKAIPLITKAREALDQINLNAITEYLTEAQKIIKKALLLAKERNSKNSVIIDDTAIEKLINNAEKLLKAIRKNKK